MRIGDFGLARVQADVDVQQGQMTNQVVTRWYRAPELLLGARHYTDRVDMWSVGAILAELLLRTPYFAGESDIGQLTLIFKALGTPVEKEWPGMASLPLHFSFATYPRVPLSSLFTAASNDTLDLLAGCLMFNPLKRWSALECLESPYFSKAPGPTPPHLLPRHVKPKDVAEVKRKLVWDQEEEDSSSMAHVRRKLF